MNYRNLLVALLFGISATAYATEKPAVTSEAASDDRIACIEAAVAEDVEEGEQFDKFVENCIQEKSAQRGKPAEKSSS